MCIDEYDTDQTITHEMVVENGVGRESVLQEFVQKMVVQIDESLQEKVEK